MATVRDYFAREAGDYLDRLDRIAQGMDEGGVAPAELHRVARALRGAAQMAREDAFGRVAGALEAAAKGVAESRAGWSSEASSRVRQAIRDLRALLLANPEDADPIAEHAIAGLGALGGPRPAADAPPKGDAVGAFREFAAREGAGVLGYVEAALKALAVNSRDREPLKAVLRRQRALMGSARLPSIPVLAETLTAIDEITRMVARQDVAVEGEWLDVYRGARDVLTPLVKSLQQGADVPPPAALLTLRNLRQQLVDRFGAEEPMRQPPVFTPQDAASPAEAPPAPPRAAAPPPAAPPAPAPVARPAAAATAQPVAAAAPDEAAPIQEYLYRGERALARALELKPELERAVASGDAAAAALVSEVFDLIELARA